MITTADLTHTTLTGRVTRARERLTPSTVTIPPSDLPAFEARRRDLRRLRADLPATALVDDEAALDAECVA